MPLITDIGRSHHAQRRLGIATGSLLVPAFLWLLIVPSVGLAEITLDGSMGSAVPLPGPNFQIGAELGQLRGGNLFHSFGKFNLVSTESATFSGPDTVVNIIGRVTGGTPSSIDGLIRSEIPGANLFLLNPYGFMFGPNATLDVKGSFHASTADYLQFPDGRFATDPAAGSSVLSVAPPTAFGFLSSSPAGISIQQSNLAVPAGRTLSIVGGDIEIAGDPAGTIYASVKAPGGTVALASAGSPGEVTLGDFLPAGIETPGNITALNTNLLAETSSIATDPAGTILIRGGKLYFQGSVLYARGNPGGLVDVRGAELRVDDSYINTGTRGAVDHPGMGVNVDVGGEVLFSNGGEIASSSFSSGRAGNVRISADTVLLGDADATKSLYSATGYYGDIGSRSNGAGRGGDVEIEAGTLTVRNGFFINTAALNIGDAGDVTVRAGTLNLLDGGSISSNAFSAGRGGTVDITAGDVLMSHRNIANVTSGPFTGIAAQADKGSPGGSVRVTANNLQILDGAKISTTLYGTGPGADIVIDAKNILISGMILDPRLAIPQMYASITARVVRSAATGTGGDILITADSVKVTDRGLISSGLFRGAPGNAGGITIVTAELELSDLGTIQASSVDGTGNAGRLDVSAKEIRIVGDRDSTDPLVNDLTGMSTATTSGQGGDLRVTTGSLFIADKGAITASTVGSGAGGKITIAAGALSLEGGATISATSSGTGNAGAIDIESTDSFASRNGSVTTEAMAADGGNIAITVPYKITLVDSKITSSVGGGPQTTGGNIVIDPDYVVLKNSRIIANAFEGTGGNITIVADTFLADPRSVVDASSALGVSGTVDIRAPIASVSGFLAPLSSDFISATALLRERCIARIREGKYSSFVVGGRDGVPIEPGNLMPSAPF